jgi:hypothetical protein
MNINIRSYRGPTVPVLIGPDSRAVGRCAVCGMAILQNHVRRVGCYTLWMECSR